MEERKIEKIKTMIKEQERLLAVLKRDVEDFIKRCEILLETERELLFG